MDGDKHKRELRKLKRTVKRAGSKRRRLHLKRELEENPEEAPHSEYEFRQDSSATLNGLDRDSTRRRHAEGDDRHDQDADESGDDE